MSIEQTPSSTQSDVQSSRPDPVESSSARSSRAADSFSITDEPIYFITAFVFCSLITVLIGLVGVTWLLPFLQTLTLTLFMLPLVRRRKIERGLTLLFGWLIIQFVLVMVLTMILPSQMERTIPDGFERRTGLLAWFYAFDEPPLGLVDGLGSRLLETGAVAVGSLVTAGLAGFWLLIRGVNLAAFYSGSILAALSDTANGIGAFPLWTVCRLVGYGLVSTLSACLLFGNDQQLLGGYLRQRRTLWIVAFILILLGIVFENTMPNLWRTWFS